MPPHPSLVHVYVCTTAYEDTYSKSKSVVMEGPCLIGPFLEYKGAAHFPTGIPFPSCVVTALNLWVEFHNPSWAKHLLS